MREKKKEKKIENMKQDISDPVHTSFFLYNMYIHFNRYFIYNI